MTRPRHTVLITLALAAVVAVVALPNPEPPETSYVVDALRQQSMIARTRYAIQSEYFRRAHSRVVARDMAARAARVDSATVVSVPKDMSPIFADYFRRAMMHEPLALTPPGARIKTVATVLFDTGTVVAGTDVMKMYGASSADIFLPGSVASNACVVVVRIHYEKELRKLDSLNLEPYGAVRTNQFYARYGNLIGGPCWWYTTYGMPGRGIAAWLDSTGYAGIRRRHAERYSFSDDEARRYWVSRSHAPLAIRAGLACAAGKRSTCTSLFLGAYDEPAIASWTLPSAGWIGYSRENSDALSESDNLLVRLRAELGDRDFAAFWRSDAPVAEAFAAARGESLDRWVQNEMIRMGMLVLPSTLPRVPTFAGVLLAIAALLGVGLYAVNRRGGFA